MSLPLLTRALSVLFSAAADGGLAVRASLLDMRKIGVVPVGGPLDQRRRPDDPVPTLWPGCASQPNHHRPVTRL